MKNLYCFLLLCFGISITAFASGSDDDLSAIIGQLREKGMATIQIGGEGSSANPLKTMIKERKDRYTFMDVVDNKPVTYTREKTFAPMSDAMQAISSRANALIFGGCHLDRDEAFEFCREIARSVVTSSAGILYPGDQRHVGHTVINIDEGVLPDHVASAVEEGLIERLEYTEKFNTVVVEMVPNSLKRNPILYRNAFNALKSGGTLVVHEMRATDRAIVEAERAGFRDMKCHEPNTFRDFLTGRDPVFWPVCTFRKL